MIEYKGFHTEIYYSMEDDIYFGKIEDIEPLVSFEGRNYFVAIENFQGVVDYYLEEVL